MKHSRRAWRQRGWASSEYVAVLMGLMVVWRGSQAMVALLQRHHNDVAWAMMIPF